MSYRQKMPQTAAFYDAFVDVFGVGQVKLTYAEENEIVRGIQPFKIEIEPIVHEHRYLQAYARRK